MRTKMALAMSAVVLLLVTACTSQPSTAQPSTAQSAVASQSAAPKLEDSLVFASPGAGVQTGYQKCAIDAFQRKYNVRVDYLAGQGNENIARAVAQKNNPNIDVFLFNLTELYSAAQQDLVVPVNPASVPNLAFVDSGTTLKYGVGVPIARSIQTGIQYNTKIFRDNNWAPPTSWNDLWDSRFKGHVAIYTLTVGAAQYFLQVIAQINGGTVSNVEPAFVRMAQLKPNLYAVYSTAGQMDQGFQQGNVWIAMNSSARTLQLKQSGVPVELVQAKEGLALNVNHLALGKGAPHPNAAAVFINWILSKDVQSCLPTDIGFGSVRNDVTAPPNLALYMGPLPGTKVLPTDEAEISKQLSSWVLRWNKEIETK